MTNDRGGQLFDEFVVSRDGREVLTFDIDVDAPAYGSRYASPLGRALCVFSDTPQSGNGLDEVVARLIANPGATALYRSVATWLDYRPEGWWILSHDIDNEVLSWRIVGPSDHGLEHYLELLRDYETVQTESRRLTFLCEAPSRIVDYVWDSEAFAVFLHAPSDVAVP